MYGTGRPASRCVQGPQNRRTPIRVTGVSIGFLVNAQPNLSGPALEKPSGPRFQQTFREGRGKDPGRPTGQWVGGGSSRPKAFRPCGVLSPPRSEALPSLPPGLHIFYPGHRCPKAMIHPRFLCPSRNGNPMYRLKAGRKSQATCQHSSFGLPPFFLERIMVAAVAA